MKQLRWVYCKLVFPEANHLPGVIWPNLVRAAREANLYTNLITSGVGLDDERRACACAMRASIPSS